jgi:hypothetical protein
LETDLHHEVGHAATIAEAVDLVEKWLGIPEADN